MTTLKMFENDLGWLVNIMLLHLRVLLNNVSKWHCLKLHIRVFVTAWQQTCNLSRNVNLSNNLNVSDSSLYHVDAKYFLELYYIYVLFNKR